jgi:DNA-binding MarR family transcriptional regulator
MNTQLQNPQASVATGWATPPPEQLAPTPITLDDTGLSEQFIKELVAKHFYSAGVLILADLVHRTNLSPQVLDAVIGRLRAEGMLENRPATDTGALRYALTDRGRALATESLLKSGYVGPAPVPLEDYRRVVAAQSVHQRVVTRPMMEGTFSDTILHDGLLHQLGPAMSSGRPIFIYGPAGTGKTYTTQRLGRLFEDNVLVPYALAVGDSVIQLFDPVYHHVVGSDENPPTLIPERRYDHRYALCRRPVIMSGGELDLDMLDIHYDNQTRLYQAPLQLKANNGMYLIDDLGRQLVEPEVLLNRWTVPMEERHDYLKLGTGIHFPVPFEVVLVFSTNLNPLDLADEAFLRRLGYKIRFDYLTPEEFEGIWHQFCDTKGLGFDASLVHKVIKEFYEPNEAPLLPCHPRDLIELALGQARYDGRGNELTFEDLGAAWKSYFVRLR